MLSCRCASESLASFTACLAIWMSRDEGKTPGSFLSSSLSTSPSTAIPRVRSHSCVRSSLSPTFATSTRCVAACIGGVLALVSDPSRCNSRSAAFISASFDADEAVARLVILSRSASIPRTFRYPSSIMFWAALCTSGRALVSDSACSTTACGLSHCKATNSKTKRRYCTSDSTIRRFGTLTISSPSALGLLPFLYSASACVHAFTSTSSSDSSDASVLLPRTSRRM
mmetsp:Transcript_14528/g.35567  ORF Transcript_14528/g.35567 Transcript_14528/m.35567 type:complete len:227 (-) Transcript_14528:274-954(-)